MPRRCSPPALVLTAALLVLAATALTGLSPAARAQQAASCSFANQRPAPGSTELDPFPNVTFDVACQQPITSVSVSIDSVRLAVWTKHPASGDRTSASALAELAGPLGAGTHTVRAEVTAGGTAAAQWAFTTPSPAPCGALLPSGDTIGRSSTAFIVWGSGSSIVLRPCPASSVAADVARATGRTVAALWYFKNETGIWQVYLPAASAGSLVVVPGFAALVIAFA